MMNTAEMLLAIAETLAADEELNNWCSTVYGKNVEVFLGSNLEVPPSEEHYPLVAITEVRQVRQPGSVEVGWQVRLSALVKNENVEVAGQITKYTGFLQAERLRELAEYALEKASVPNTFRKQGESISVVSFPLFESQTTIVTRELRRGNV